MQIHKWDYTVPLTSCSTTLNHSVGNWQQFLVFLIVLFQTQHWSCCFNQILCYFITDFFSHTCAFNVYIFITTSPWLSNKSLDIVSLEVTLLQVILLSLYHQIHWKNNLCSQLPLFHLHLIQIEFCYATILKLEFQCMKNS